LNETGADHPGGDEMIAAGETDWRKIIAQLTGRFQMMRAFFLSENK